jgi:preprotein translocase subunit SecG
MAVGFFGRKYAEVKEMTIALTILQMLCAVALIISVLLQSSKSAGLSGSIAGGAETFFGKKKGMDEMLTKVSAVAAALFLVLTLLLSVF